MSGLCGFLRLDGGPASLATLQRQMSALAHRAKHGKGHFCAGPLALSHLATHVLPEDRSDSQPLADHECGIVLVADIRLDNRQALIGELDLDAEATRWPDSHILLSAWRRWGEAMVDRLLGDFIVIVWDQRSRKLFLARDATGQRNLFFFHNEEIFAFASEVKGLWPVDEVPKRLNDRFFSHLLLPTAGYAPLETAFACIRAVRPGTVKVIQADGRSHERQFWSAKPDPAWVGLREAEYIEAYRETLKIAVICRLRSIGNAGLFLSGGFDSSLIAAIGGPHLAAERRKLQCYSYALNGDDRGLPSPNLRWIESCNKHISGLDVHFVNPVGKTPLSDWVTAIHQADGPVPGYHYLTSHILDVSAQAGVRVILDGHGGDLTLNPCSPAVYLNHLICTGRLLRALRELPAMVRAGGVTWRHALQSWTLAPFLPDALRQQWRNFRGRPSRAGVGILMSDALQQNLAQEGIQQADFPPSGRSFRPGDREDYHRRVLERHLGNASVFLSNESAHRGMDIARPYMDRRVVELGLAIPITLHYRNGISRHLGRSAFGDALPPGFRRGDNRKEIMPLDHHRRVLSARAELLALATHCEQRQRQTHINFNRIRMLMARACGEAPEGEVIRDAAKAAYGVLIAAFIDHHDQSNYRPD